MYLVAQPSDECIGPYEGKFDVSLYDNQDEFFVEGEICQAVTPSARAINPSSSTSQFPGAVHVTAIPLTSLGVLVCGMEQLFQNTAEETSVYRRVCCSYYNKLSSWNKDSTSDGTTSASQTR